MKKDKVTFSKWSNGTKQEKSPIRKLDDVVEPVIEYVNPVARALNDTETWMIDDQGEFHPTIPYSVENVGVKKEGMYGMGV
jgi:hypothetical protein